MKNTSSKMCIVFGANPDLMEIIELLMKKEDLENELNVIVADDVVNDFNKESCCIGSINLNGLTARESIGEITRHFELHLTEMEDGVFVISKQPLDTNIANPK